MSVPAFAWAMAQGRALHMPASERMLLIALADRANGEGYCYPGQDTLADDTGLTSRSVRDLAICLERRGLIRIERRGRSLCYHIVKPNGADAAAAKHRKSVPASGTVKAEAASGIKPEHSSGMGYPATTKPEVASGIKAEAASAHKRDTGNWRTRHRKLVHEIPEAASAEPFFNQVREPRVPPRSPPASGGAARSDDHLLLARRNFRNGAHDLAREMDAEMAAAGTTIEGTADDVTDFQAFVRRRRIGGGYG